MNFKLRHVKSAQCTENITKGHEFRKESTVAKGGPRGRLLWYYNAPVSDRVILFTFKKSPSQKNNYFKKRYYNLFGVYCVCMWEPKLVTHRGQGTIGLWLILPLHQVSGLVVVPRCPYLLSHFASTGTELPG